MSHTLLLSLILLILFSCGKPGNESGNEAFGLQDSVKMESVAVLGFHLSWMKDEASKKYRYNSLSAICYAECELNPNTGSYKSTNDWLTTVVVDSAKVNGAKVYLGISIKGLTGSEIFLRNYQATLTSIDTISHLLMARDADGVVIHFENIPDSHKFNFTDYIKELHKRLSAQNKTIIISIPGFELRQNTYLDVYPLNTFVEYFIIGKSFFGNDEFGSPVEPFFSDTSRYVESIKHTIPHYANQKVPVSKLMVTIPYYRGGFKIEDTNLFENNVGGIGILCGSQKTD